MRSRLLNHRIGKIPVNSTAITTGRDAHSGNLKEMTTQILGVIIYILEFVVIEIVSLATIAALNTKAVFAAKITTTLSDQGMVKLQRRIQRHFTITRVANKRLFRIKTANRINHTGGPVIALDFNGDTHHCLKTAFDLFNRNDLATTANP